MPTEPSQLDQAVSRTLRDNLERLQRTAEELSSAIADLVAACASNRPANALPPMLRAQSSAAALSAALEVLSNFVTRALQATPEAETVTPVVRAVTTEAPEQPTPPPRSVPTPMASAPASASPAEVEARQGAGSAPEVQAQEVAAIEEAAEELAETPEQAAAEVAEQAAAAAFDIAAMSTEVQELHRRANRVAKVSMQDIKLLRPEQVRLGRVHKDLCLRLRDDIEKARKEYDRRFQAILGHPVDYFYHWMVEILGAGDPQSLGEYPYTSPVLRR